MGRSDPSQCLKNPAHRVDQQHIAAPTHCLYNQFNLRRDSFVIAFGNMQGQHTLVVRLTDVYNSATANVLAKEE